MFWVVLLILVSRIMFCTENLVMPYYQFIHRNLGVGSFLAGVLVYIPGTPCVEQAPGTHGSPPSCLSLPIVALKVLEV